MKVEFLSKFNKDLDKIQDKNVLKAIKSTILQIENSGSIKEISKIKKMKPLKTAYRIRLGDYRIGVFIERGKVEFARVAHRKDIYKYFP